jgi:glyoxylase-like metal-dependent hydrolase (beta-lactamase superfamily II)
MSNASNRIDTWAVGWLCLAMTLLSSVNGVCGEKPMPVADATSIRAVLRASPRADYRLFALCIGRSLRARRGLFIADPSLPKFIEVTFSFWVLESADRIILIDSGFINRKMVDSWEIKDFKTPDKALQWISIRPQQVTDVIITHSHWDHMGGISLFPNARLWINQIELDALKKRNGDKLPRAFARAAQNNRLCVTRAIQSIAPSVVVVPAGMHTPGLQYVVVGQDTKPWVFASDIAPLFVNFRRRKPTGQSSDAASTLKVQDTILELVEGDLRRIVPGHEPSIYDLTPFVELDTTWKGQSTPTRY